ncbi:MAG: glycoside hydrolase family protein [Saprospiraceae bacterium]|nr:glycoside hydrolase family protein [Saprospiraceae bacterium]
MVHTGRCNGTEPEEFRRGITQDRATALLRERLQQFEDAINRLVTVNLSQTQFDALASFVFNIGVGSFNHSTLLRVLNEGNYAQVPVEMNKWVHINRTQVSQGLVNRRRMEAALFERAEYPASTTQSLSFSKEFLKALEVVSRELNAGNRTGYALSNVSYNVPGPFNIIRQPSGMTCWATVTTMMECWRLRQSQTIETTMSSIGANWLAKFQANQGLSASEKVQFLRDAGLTFEYPQSLTAQGWEYLMRDFGPIWVTTDEDPSGNFAIHARILVGIQGDGTIEGTQLTIIDPGTGTQYSEEFAHFLEKYESEARDSRAPLRIQIVHYAQQQSQLTRSQSMSMRLDPSNLSQMNAVWRSMQFSNDIPLTPATGGMSISTNALQSGDIVLSTTSAMISSAIRAFTNSPVSHVSVFVGEGVIEAVGSGVELKTVETAISDDTVAVAFRHPQMTPEKALQLRDYLGQQLGKPYNHWGIVRQAAFRVESSQCSLVPTDTLREACRNFYGKIFLGTADNQTFFCSQLVVEAFSRIGLPIINTPANWSTPDDIVNLTYQGNLQYVGHLKTP